MRLPRFIILLTILLIVILYIVPHVHAQDDSNNSDGSDDTSPTDGSDDTSPTDDSTPTDDSSTPTDNSSPPDPSVTDILVPPVTNVVPNNPPVQSLPPDPDQSTDDDTGGDVADMDCMSSADQDCSSSGIPYQTPVAQDTAPGTSDDPFPFVMVDKNALDLNKQNMGNADKMLQDTLFYLHFYARGYAFSNSTRNYVYTVTTKEELAPSNSSHDYLSLARYFWPNNKTLDGLPYVRRDGFVNPEINKAPDYTYFHSVVKSLTFLSYAFFFYNDEDFAQVAINRIDSWFINPKTRMNPHLQYASLIRGYNTGRAKGVIDFHILPDLMTSISILQSSVHWKAGTSAALRQWFTQYRQWLHESPNGLMEASSVNNHGTWYDVQYASLSIFLNDTQTAKTYLQNCTGRIDAQILPTGQMPFETARPFSFFYTSFNTIGLFQLATLAQKVGVDLFHYQSPNGGSMQKALDFYMPYIPSTYTTKSSWPYLNTDGFNATYNMPAVLYQAYVIYGDPKYHDMAVLLSRGWSHTSNLTRLSLPWEQFGVQKPSNIQISNAQSISHTSIFSVTYAIVAILVFSLLRQ